jgi:hypothetical protein
MTNIQTALSTFTGALSSFEAARAALHAAHLKAETACTDGVSNEASTSLASAGAASKLGMSALVSELALLAVSVGTETIDKDGATAEITEIDGLLKAFEASREALDKARAALDTAFDAERSRALAVRAKLAGIAGEAPKKS